MEHLEGTFTGTGGLNLYFQVWRPRTTPLGILGIVHGVGEHSGRYATLVNHLVSRRIAVWGYDHRGHGRSQGRRVHVRRWSEYLDDLHLFRRLVADREAERPLGLLGHSMGALILLEYLAAHQEGLHGAVISGAPIRPLGVAKPHLILLARALSPIAPWLPIRTRLDVEALSREPAVVRAYRTDGRVYGAASVRWGTEALAAVERVKRLLPAIRLPLLIVHGGADRLNAPEGAQWAWERVASPDKTLRIYPGAYHEPHNDTCAAEVAREIGDWLLARW